MKCDSIKKCMGCGSPLAGVKQKRYCDHCTVKRHGEVVMRGYYKNKFKQRPMKTIKLELYSKSSQEIEDIQTDCETIAEEYGAEITVND